MRRLLVLALLVPLVADCGWASFLLGGHATSSRTIYPTAPVSRVPRWIEVEHLPQKAAAPARDLP